MFKKKEKIANCNKPMISRQRVCLILTRFSKEPDSNESKGVPAIDR